MSLFLVDSLDVDTRSGRVLFVECELSQAAPFSKALEAPAANNAAGQWLYVGIADTAAAPRPVRLNQRPSSVP